MPRHIGIVGVSAEGAALCYRTICTEGAPIFGRHTHPEISLHTYPLAAYMRQIGTKYLTEGPVYPAKLRARGIEIDSPRANRRVQIDTFIFEELVSGHLKEATRSVFAEIIAEGRQRGNEAVVLGCTEIPLLIGDQDSALPTLDSTRILARAALREAARDTLLPDADTIEATRGRLTPRQHP